MDKYRPSFLFHRPKFIFRDSQTSVVRFENQSAEIYFSNHQQSLISLPASPFGGFLTDREISKGDLLACLNEIHEWSARNSISEVVIRLFPNEYHPEFAAMITETLMEASFRVLYTDVTQYIPVTGNGSMELDIHKKRRLRNSDALGFQFRSLTSDFLDQSYALFVQSRDNKGYPVSMSLDGLRNMFVLFPDEYLLFGVFDKEKMIAASVSIKVSEEILYCFYIGDDLEYRSQSPVTALVSGIYAYCKTNGFEMLDLGLSTDKGIVNKGLYAFKKSFGALESPKLIFTRNL